LFFGFLTDCDEEGTRIVRCSTKSKKKNDKKVLPLLVSSMSPPLSSPLHNKKECKEVLTIVATQEKESGELVEISRTKLYVMQVFAWFTKNHNFVANLLVTLIFIHEFFNCKNIGLELFHLVYR
jgi:hypothetical protein